MSVRAKFTVASITRHAHWSAVTVKLQPQYDTSIPEDQRYSKATPSGQMELMIDNPLASDQFVLGQSFYVDFTPVTPTAEKTNA